MVHFCHSRAVLPQLPVIFIICKRASRVFFFQKWSCWVPEKKHSLTNEPCLNYSFKQEWAYKYKLCQKKRKASHFFSSLLYICHAAIVSWEIHPNTVVQLDPYLHKLRKNNNPSPKNKRCLLIESFTSLIYFGLTETHWQMVEIKIWLKKAADLMFWKPGDHVLSLQSKCGPRERLFFVTMFW